jgi:hypothetical protein
MHQVTSFDINGILWRLDQGDLAPRKASVLTVLKVPPITGRDIERLLLWTGATQRELAAHLRISVKTLQNYIRQGETLIADSCLCYAIDTLLSLQIRINGRFVSGHDWVTTRMLQKGDLGLPPQKGRRMVIKRGGEEGYRG